SPEKLLDEADAALAAHHFARAIELYEQAEPRATDPGRVTFGLATAKYHQAAKDGSASGLYEAEQLYRCLLGGHESRRKQALFGVGNCLVERGGQRDTDSLVLAL